MSTTTSLPEAIATLRANFLGTLLQPADHGYDDARRVHNGLIDQHPALIAQCRGAQDLAAALSLAKEQSLAVSVRAKSRRASVRMRISSSSGRPGM